MELNEQEAHCIARLLQGAFFGDSPFDGCSFCKFQCYKEGNNNLVTKAGAIRCKLTEETGVDLGFYEEPRLFKSNFPYSRFMHGANIEAKLYFQEQFDKICNGTAPKILRPKPKPPEQKTPE